ncbi:PREDICTED: uncharacterized protein LOC102249418 isoform X1 [Myotis brandtii]|uniref:uncharacterized protein LOC102249418 isoform X1 n=1 Tax=Myotis brandtii TaxID=109478 RepID=UPI00070447D1|nr:PREDICTED: uncharacterized protein LOC102249418 isoform X1 [Myotis brandtii]
MPSDWSCNLSFLGLQPAGPTVTVGIEAVGLRTSSCSSVGTSAAAQQPRSFSPVLGRPRGRGRVLRGRFEVLATTLLRTKTPASAWLCLRASEIYGERAQEMGSHGGDGAGGQHVFGAGGTDPSGAWGPRPPRCILRGSPPPPAQHLLSLREEECGTVGLGESASPGRSGSGTACAAAPSGGPRRGEQTSPEPRDPVVSATSHSTDPGFLGAPRPRSRPQRPVVRPSPLCLDTRGDSGGRQLVEGASRLWTHLQGCFLVCFFL